IGKERVPLSKYVKERYAVPYERHDYMSPSGSTGRVSDQDQWNYMEMLSIFQQLDPPTYLRSSSDTSVSDPDTITAHREVGRELDLSAWFTRPCLIILGYLKDSEC